jgi:zona occludens toxin (predicted ATPase)
MKTAKIAVLLVILACCVGVVVYVLRSRPATSGKSAELRQPGAGVRVEEKYGVTSESVSP